MFCHNCGYRFSNEMNFCPNCGQKILNQNKKIENNTYKTFSLKCKQCGGELTIQSDKTVISCPFCGSKELIIENDVVKVAKINANVNRDIKFEKQKTLLKIKQLDLKNKNNIYMQYFYSKLLSMGLILLGAGIFIFCVENGHLFSSGAKLFITILCPALVILGYNLFTHNKD